MITDWTYIGLYFILLYVIGFIITKLIGLRKNRLWLWLIISWGIWLIVSIIYRFVFITPDYLSYEVSDLKQKMDQIWLLSLFTPVHHILFIVSLFVLLKNKIKVHTKTHG